MTEISSDLRTRTSSLCGSQSDAVQHYIASCRGTAMPMRVNLSSNSCPTYALPPLIPPMDWGEVKNQKSKVRTPENLFRGCTFFFLVANL